MAKKLKKAAKETELAASSKLLDVSIKEVSDEELARYFPSKRPNCFKGKYEAEILVDTESNCSYLIHIHPKNAAKATSNPLDVVYLYNEDDREVFISAITPKELQDYIEEECVGLGLVNNLYRPLKEEDQRDRFNNVMWFFDVDLFDDNDCPWENSYYDHDEDRDEFLKFCEECKRCRKLHQGIKTGCNAFRQQTCATLWTARKYAKK